MNRDQITKLFSSALIAAVFVLGLSVNANAQTQKGKAAFHPGTAAQQPRFTEYKGVKLGISADEARAKLGTPAMKDSDQDFYVFSENETAQIVYNTAQKVITISIDYLGGIGAPDSKAVVEGELETKANGSLYRIVRYESRGFWVSYSRTAGPVATVTVTLQQF